MCSLCTFKFILAEKQKRLQVILSLLQNIQSTFKIGISWIFILSTSSNDLITLFNTVVCLISYLICAKWDVLYEMRWPRINSNKNCNSFVEVPASRVHLRCANTHICCGLILRRWWNSKVWIQNHLYIARLCFVQHRSNGSWPTEILCWRTWGNVRGHKDRHTFLRKYYCRFDAPAKKLLS